jgi:hypothetical protein
MDLTQWVSSIVAFVRAGYPSGMPTVGATHITNAIPSPEDIARVRRRLDRQAASSA